MISHFRRLFPRMHYQKNHSLHAQGGYFILKRTRYWSRKTGWVGNRL